jgi:hypothetical protein
MLIKTGGCMAASQLPGGRSKCVNSAQSALSSRWDERENNGFNEKKVLQFWHHAC